MRNTSIALTCVLCACACVMADRTWVGNSGLWSDPLNWDPQSLPGASDTAIFDASLSYNVLVDDDYTISNIDFITGQATFLAFNGSPRVIEVVGDAGVEMSDGVMQLQGIALELTDPSGAVDVDAGQMSLTGSSLTAFGLLVGAPNGTATMDVLGSSIAAEFVTVGLSGDGTLNVSGATSVCDLDANCVVGDGTDATAMFTISNDADATIHGLFLGTSFDGLSSATFTVTGPGSTCAIETSLLTVGNNEDNGTAVLIVDDDAEFTMQNMTVNGTGTFDHRGGTVTSEGAVLIDGGQWLRSSGTTFNPDLFIQHEIRNEGVMNWNTSVVFGHGFSNPPAQWDVLSGSLAEVSFAWHIGSVAGTHGRTIVDSDFGVSAQRSMLRGAGGGGGADLIVGDAGDGELQVLGGSLADFGDDFILGFGPGSSGVVDVSGVGGGFRSTVDITRAGADATFGVGRAGMGDCTIADGGLVDVGGACRVGTLTGATGLLTVSGGSNGSSAQLDVGTDLSIGGTASSDGGTGTMIVTQGGDLNVGGAIHVWPSDSLKVCESGTAHAAGNFVARGSVEVCSGGSLIADSMFIQDAGAMDQVHVGESTGRGAGALSTVILNSSLHVGGDDFGPSGDGRLGIHRLGQVQTDDCTVWDGGVLTIDDDPTDQGRLTLLNAGLTNHGTIYGDGRVDVTSITTFDFNNFGALYVAGEHQPGDFHLSGLDAHLHPGGTLYVDLGGTADGQFDVLRCLGNTDITLDGTLNIVFINGFEPKLNDEFTILTAGILDVPHISGSFAEVIAPAGYAFEMVVTNFEATLRVIGVPCAADIAGDDDAVDVFDLLELLASWGACPGCAADLTGDDVVDVFDLLDLLSAWGPC